MPFSELIKLAKGKVDATQQKTSNLSTDLPYGGGNDCAELVWDNGQIIVQNQSSRARKAPFSNNFPLFNSNTRDGKDAKNSKAKLSTIGSELNDFPLSAPSSEMGLDQDDNVVPWLSCPTVEPFNNAYCSYILPEPFGVMGNELSTDNSLAFMERRNSSNHMEFVDASSQANGLSLQQGSTSKILSSATEINRHNNTETASFIQRQHTLPRTGSSELNCSDAGNANCAVIKNSIPFSSLMGGSKGMKLHKVNAGQPSNASGLMNFSYFSRFASLSGVNMQNAATNAGADPSSTQRVDNENYGSAMSSHNHVKSTIMNSSVAFSQQESSSNAQPSMPPPNGCVESVTSKSDSIPPRHPIARWREPDAKSDKSLDKPFVSLPTKLVVEGEMIPEPVVATSSVCSGNSLERASNNPTNNLKRKSCETGDTEGPSDEVDESVGMRKTPLGRTGSKRSRATEVHNLSERRRRDRINEKMRALKELIPNCNKVDKASMLDEAIEYLKTLQLQVQILSMGTGMCMPPVMLPAAMQHMHSVHMSQFLPMGIGMGLGMGFGTSMPNVNNSMMQMSSIQGPCYPVPCPPVSSSFSFHAAAGSSHQSLGHLGQGLSMPTPHVPISLLGGLPMRLPMGSVSGMPGIADVLHSTTSASPKDMVQNGSPQAMFNDYANSSMNRGSDQATILLNDQSKAANDDEAQNPRGGTNTNPS